MKLIIICALAAVTLMAGISSVSSHGGSEVAVPSSSPNAFVNARELIMIRTKIKVSLLQFLKQALKLRLKYLKYLQILIHACSIQKSADFKVEISVIVKQLDQCRSDTELLFTNFIKECHQYKLEIIEHVTTLINIYCVEEFVNRYGIEYLIKVIELKTEVALCFKSYIERLTEIKLSFINHISVIRKHCEFYQKEAVCDGAHEKRIEIFTKLVEFRTSALQLFIMLVKKTLYAKLLVWQHINTCIEFHVKPCYHTASVEFTQGYEECQTEVAEYTQNSECRYEDSQGQGNWNYGSYPGRYSGGWQYGRRPGSW